MRESRVLLNLLVAGLGLACAGAPSSPAGPSAPPGAPTAPVSAAPSEPTPSCCRMVGGVHNPFMDSAMCEDIGEWVTGEECRPTVCCRSSDGAAVRSTRDFCAVKADNEALPLDDAACGG